MAIRGYVSGMRPRTELSGRQWITVWDFRLERVTDDGTRLPRVPVAMRGTTFDGAINDDDLVEVDGQWHEGETLRVREAHNLTTSALVRAHGAPGDGSFGGAIGLLLRVGLLVAIAWVIWQLAMAAHLIG